MLLCHLLTSMGYSLFRFPNHTIDNEFKLLFRSVFSLPCVKQFRIEWICTIWAIIIVLLWYLSQKTVSNGKIVKLLLSDIQLKWLFVSRYFLNSKILFYQNSKLLKFHCIELSVPIPDKYTHWQALSKRHPFQWWNEINDNLIMPHEWCVLSYSLLNYKRPVSTLNEQRSFKSILC